MQFDLKHALQILERTPTVLNTLLGGLSDSWTSPNEGLETWSPYDVVGHLIHGENTDWVVRAEIILGNAKDKTFTPFDRFAQFENSKGKALGSLLIEFEQLRATNIKTVRSWNLTDKQLEKTGIHPGFGPVSLSQLFSAWTVHDLGHIHQISRVMAKQYTEAVGPWTQYLGVLGKG